VKITYVDQGKPEGTAHALFCAKNAVQTSNFIVLNGDDLYSDELIQGVLNEGGSAIVGVKEKNWQRYGVLKAKDDLFLENIIEKPQTFVGDLVNIGFYKVKDDIFKYFGEIKKSKRGEYEITDLLGLYAKKHKVKIIKNQSGWTPLSYPWDLLNLAKSTLSSLKTDIKGKVEKGAAIKGNIYLGRKSVIKAGTYLEGNFFIGKNCEIGPNCFLNGFGSIDDGVVIGNAVEVARSIIGKDTNIRHLSYAGDSIIGNNVNIGAGTIISNLRHDADNILVKVNGELVDSGRNKMGAIIGDGVKTGIQTSLYPGSKLKAGIHTKPGQVVKY
jgi:bifunctional UDP-N-acetylglucosamine pyrophosphorylase/glucosamine-1-phosphate N-acetyltransferase